jgi:excisionase family DNA binding protein
MSQKKKVPELPPVVVPAVPISPDDVLTLAEVADRLKQPPSTIYSLTRSRSVRRLPHMRCGKRLLFSWSQVSEWLRASQAVQS